MSTERASNRRADAAFADTDRIRRVLAAGRHAPLPDHDGLTAGRADELVAGLRSLVADEPVES